MEQAINYTDLPMLGENGFEYSQQFDWAIIAKKTYDLYKNL